MQLKESSIQKQIIDYLSYIARSRNFFFFSIPNEGFMTAAMAAGMDKKTMARIMMHFKKMGLTPAIPDLCILFESKAIFIEVKKPGEKPTPKQEMIHYVMEKTGHSVWIASSVEEIEQILKEEGIIK